MLCRCGVAALLTRDENVNTQRKETQSTKIKLHLQPFASELPRRGEGRRTDELKQTWWAEKVGGGKLPGASRIDRADWAVLKKDGQMKALRKDQKARRGTTACDVTQL